MSEIEESVELLLDARRNGEVVPAPQLPNAKAAYAVQQGVAEALCWFSEGTPRFWKSGGPSRDAVLTHAPLPPAGVWTSPAQARAWPLRLRGIEAEVALRLGCEVDAKLAATLDVESAQALVDAMCVSIEIVESRWAEGLEAPPLARLADLQSHGALVLGEGVPFAPRDWPRQECLVKIGTRIKRRFTGTHSLADPTFVLPALLRHVTSDGGVLPAGSVVTTGTWCGLLTAEEGELVEVSFEGIGRASVTV